MIMEVNKTINSVKFFLRRALLGMVIPSMRAICLDWKSKEDHSKLVFFHDGEVDDDIYDWYSTIESEASSGDWGDSINSFKSSFEVISLKYPEPVPEDKYIATLYHRKEPFEDPK